MNIKGQIVTIDAMGTQAEIVAKIRGKKAEYVLGLKGNQGTLHGDVGLYFADAEFFKSAIITIQLRRQEAALKNANIGKLWNDNMKLLL